MKNKTVRLLAVELLTRVESQGKSDRSHVVL